MEMINEMQLTFWAVPENEAFARVVISAFILPLNPTVEEVGDIKTAVSEAVTNAILHGYEGKKGNVELKAFLRNDGMLLLEIVDNGVGIEDIEAARKPFYTSKPDMERSGMGFSVMESFMDAVEVISDRGQGTTVRMKKRLNLS